MLWENDELQESSRFDEKKTCDAIWQQRQSSTSDATPRRLKGSELQDLIRERRYRWSLVMVYVPGSCVEHSVSHMDAAKHGSVGSEDCAKEAFGGVLGLSANDAKQTHGGSSPHLLYFGAFMRIVVSG